MPQQDRRAVTAAELVRNFGFWQTRALTAPVVVTHHGRARLVLMSAETFEELGAMEPGARDSGLEDPAKLRSLALFSGLSRYMSEALLAFDADVRVIEVNHAAERFLNRSRADLLGLDFGQAFPSLVQSLIHDRLQRALKSGQSYDFETQSAVHPGMRVAVRIFPYEGGVGVVWTDVTEREELLDSRQSLESLTHAMAAHSNLGSCRLDARGRFKLAQGKLAEWLGLAWSEMTDLHLDDLVIRTDRKRVRDAFEASWESKTPREVSACFMQRGGEDLALELVLSPIVRDFAVQDMMLLATRGPGAD